MSNDTWVLRDTSRGTGRELDSRAEAEDAKQDLIGIGADAEDLEIIPPGDDTTATDGGDSESMPVDEKVTSEVEKSHATTTVDDRGNASVETTTPGAVEDVDTGALADLGESLTDDPLDILPSYMITNVDGDPTLNKRGVSVLAFHFDVDVVDYEVLLHPHECDFEAAAMRFVVERDGKTYVGHGEAHTDEMNKAKLLRMAETRAYKRAVIFATGTGIVGYQEVMNDL